MTNLSTKLRRFLKGEPEQLIGSEPSENENTYYRMPESRMGALFGHACSELRRIEEEAIRRGFETSIGITEEVVRSKELMSWKDGEIETSEYKITQVKLTGNNLKGAKEQLSVSLDYCNQRSGCEVIIKSEGESEFTSKGFNSLERIVERYSKEIKGGEVTDKLRLLGVPEDLIDEVQEFIDVEEPGLELLSTRSLSSLVLEFSSSLEGLERRLVAKIMPNVKDGINPFIARNIDYLTLIGEIPELGPASIKLVDSIRGKDFSALITLHADYDRESDNNSQAYLSLKRAATVFLAKALGMPEESCLMWDLNPQVTQLFNLAMHHSLTKKYMDRPEFEDPIIPQITETDAIIERLRMVEGRSDKVKRIVEQLTRHQSIMREVNAFIQDPSILGNDDSCQDNYFGRLKVVPGDYDLVRRTNPSMVLASQSLHNVEMQTRVYHLFRIFIERPYGIISQEEPEIQRRVKTLAFAKNMQKAAFKLSKGAKADREIANVEYFANLI